MSHVPQIVGYEKLGCVYVLTNKVNGMQYVGITKHSGIARYKAHVKAAYNKTTYYLQNAIKAYGRDAFDVKEVYHSANWDVLCKAESMTIHRLNTRRPNGYNLTDGGEGVHNVDKYSKLKNIEGLKRAWADPDRRKKRLESFKQQIPKDVITGENTNWSGFWKSVWAVPEHRAKQLTNLENIRSDKECQARRRASIIKAWKDPEALQRRREAARLRWQNPAYAEKVKAGVQRALERKRCNA